MIFVTSACASVPGRPDIRQVQAQPGRFVDHSVTVTGEVTTSWGVPFVGFNVYRVADGTGEITVVSTDRRVPGKGAGSKCGARWRTWRCSAAGHSAFTCGNSASDTANHQIQTTCRSGVAAALAESATNPGRPGRV